MAVESTVLEHRTTVNAKKKKKGMRRHSDGVPRRTALGCAHSPRLSSMEFPSRLAGLGRELKETAGLSGGVQRHHAADQYHSPCVSESRGGANRYGGARGD